MNNELYTSIKRKCSNISLSSQKKSDCVKMIEVLDKVGNQLLFSLINTYNKEYKLEYQGKTVKTHSMNSIDVTFILDDLPDLLQQMIYELVFLHYTNMKEEEKRSELVSGLPE